MKVNVIVQCSQHFQGPLTDRLQVRDKMFIYSVALLLLVAKINPSHACSGLCKINESPKTSVDYRICGDVIMETYTKLCGITRRNDITKEQDHSTVFDSHLLAKRFLISRRQNNGATDIVEECCTEGCRAEEVKEYCS